MVWLIVLILKKYLSINMKSLYEGILGDIDSNVNKMDKDIDIALNFPDKNDPMALKYERTPVGGVRTYTWFYHRAMDNDSVAEFLKNNDTKYKSEGWNKTKICIQIITNKVSESSKNTLKHIIRIGFYDGYRFISAGARTELYNGSINKVIDYAYNLLCIIRDNPEMIEWICKQWLKNYGNQKNSLGSHVKDLETFKEVMKKFDK